MLIDFTNLKNLPVQTQSGQTLGKLESIIIDIDSQSIYQYEVKPTGIKNLFGKNLLISREQVISIDKDKIIVQDSSEYQENADADKEPSQLQPHLQAQPIARQ
ncbi:MAG: hypothetical protein CO042_03995 [Parcubacteria group bacterium CG_4_9_14_0_2_um_filter_41_8]|nr:MAG: hypothetical protein AUJ34_02360 [Parcubacteria group bacterium CG1_02_41_12]PIP67145.1 MAG: hypothetical protein COW93_01770 [Parcubacteria group bacterium CG22_combo_CG10-13_8_21_14_all_41_9]PIQ80147.1 MAG: hypothetical protein COV79_02005 [Parcubacteria group bacterium CG11_big_fil_rev_8_21_14_0_20_41_14]PIR57577.1 MAG: hypothetical protein COU72_00200 [Parcubacteria group bacterium CG10_big_fil_rev_8_21_14_0_10_41_35]PIZ80858.1 MAG: hypothetical protein COY02_03400 [Parcubacteria gr